MITQQPRGRLDRHRRRIVLAVAAVLAILSPLTLALPAQASASAYAALPPPVPGPLIRIVYNYNTPIPSWVNWTGGLHEYGSFRITSNTARDVIWQSMGMYFEFDACQFVRIRYLHPDGSHWYYQPATAAFVCGGGDRSQVTLDRNAPVNTRFRLQCWADTRAGRSPDNPCAGSFTF